MDILQASKSANQEYIFITDYPEKLTYTIIIKNESEFLAQNVIVTDIIPFGAVFMQNSVSVNGVSMNGSNPNTGIDIGHIQKGKMAIITFDVEICPQSPPEEIENYATISYKDCSNEGKVVSINTNVVTTQIASLCVNLTKSVDKCISNKNDILNYSILIENKSNIPIDNLILQDILPEEVTVLPQSILVNGGKVPGDLSSGLKLGTLCAGCITLVVFQSRLDCNPYYLKIDNIASLTFDYTIYLKDTVLTSNGSQVSNMVSTSVAPNSFKEFMVSSKLPIPCSTHGVSDIINQFVDVEITNIDVIDTIRGLSCEGENLTGKKVIVNGTLMERIEYIELCSDKCIKVAEYNIHFNTFIVLPENYKETKSVKIDSSIVDIDMKLIDSKTLYQSVSLLLEVVY